MDYLWILEAQAIGPCIIERKANILAGKEPTSLLEAGQAPARTVLASRIKKANCHRGMAPSSKLFMPHK
jgi:hypothetical protein